MSKQRRGRGLGLWPLIVLIGQIVSGWRAERNYRALPEVAPTELRALPGDKGWPGISVIIPARNEEANLTPLLDSLISQDYPLYEVIVIDDCSTDGTAALVRCYAKRGVRLVQSDGPPPGWTGKNAACWLGVNESTHPWLLFVDADTTLAPLTLRSSITFALEQHVGAISLLTRQRCETFWEQLLLPFAYQQYFVGVNAQRIHSPKGPALANGQCFLIHRETYLQAGGHAANASSVIDDVALATRLKRLGTIPLACRGEMLVSVRMYTNLREIIAGFSKNSYLFLRQSPSTGIQTAISASLAASVGVLFWRAWRRRSWPTFVVALGAYTAQVLSARPWSRRFGVSKLYALLMPFSALTFLGIALNSMLRVLTRRPLPWKGRSYRSSSTIAIPGSIARKWLIEMGRAILTNTPRSIIEDSALSVRVMPKTPCVTGVEHIPAEGSFVLVANHYQRLNLWIGWSGALLIDAIARKRTISMHVVTTDRARIGSFTFPGTRWLIERVASVWGLVLVTPPAVAHEKTGRKHYALLRLLRLLKRANGHDACLVLMPEGDEGGTTGLIDALPGSGRALAALSSRHLPIVPVGVWDEDGRMYANFGEPFSLQFPPTVKTREALDTLARQTVMEHIAALLPPALRGKYGRQIDGALE
jgi:chlorobactene glucosyltransferase